MHRNNLKHADKYIKGHKKQQKWLKSISVLSVCVAVSTLYLLNKPATAVSQENASTVGMVLTEGENAGGNTDLNLSSAENTADKKNTENTANSDNADKTSDAGSAGRTDTKSPQAGTSSSSSPDTSKTAASSTSGSSAKAANTAADTPSAAASDSSSSQLPSSSASTAGSENADTHKNITITEQFVDLAGKAIAEDKIIAGGSTADKNAEEEIDLTKPQTQIDGYHYQKAVINDQTVLKLQKKAYSEASYKTGADTAAQPVTDSEISNESKAAAAAGSEMETGTESKAAAGTGSEIETVDSIPTEIKYYYQYTLEDGSIVTVKENTTIRLIYEADAAAITVKATFVDEAGNEIDSSKYTEIALPEFNEDGRLSLDDIENPPYENFTAADEQNPFKVTEYQYEKAVIGEETILSLKKEAKTDTADGECVYSYTADGTNWTEITSDTVIRMIFSSGKKAVYEFENEALKAEVTLEYPDAVPDDASLEVTPVLPDTEGYNYDAYLQALNEKASDIAAESKNTTPLHYNDENTLLYDIAFIYEETEVEPVRGTVSVSITLKEKQISEDLGASNAEDITLLHLPLSDEAKEDNLLAGSAAGIATSDISIEMVPGTTAQISEEAEALSFQTDSFSIFTIVKNNANTWSGSVTMSAEEVVNLLGDATDYGAVAEEYYGTSHSETNIAVTNLHEMENQSIGNSSKVYTNITDYGIKVTKTVAGDASDKSGTFRFALFSDSEGKNKIADTEFFVTTASDGTGEAMVKGSFSSGNTAVYVFELDTSGNPIQSGGSYKEGNVEYTVSYEGDGISGGNSVSERFSASYVKNNETGKNPQDLLSPCPGNVLYYGNGTADSYNAVHHPEQEGDPLTIHSAYPMDVADLLSKLSGTSSKLANLNASNDVEVLNVIGTSAGFLADTANALGYSDLNYIQNTGITLSGDTILVINIDLTSFAAQELEYTIPHFKVNGIQTGDWSSQIADRIIINPVQKAEGTYSAYSGKLCLETISGTIVAPKASVKTTGSICGAIFADTIYQGCEIHKVSIRKYGNAKGTIAVVNTPSYKDAVTIAVQKEWRNSDSSAISDETKEKFTQVSVKLMQTYEDSKEPPAQIGDEIVLSSSNNWQHTITGLVKEKDETHPYIYYIVETSRDGAVLTDDSNSNIMYYSINGTTKSEETTDPAKSTVQATGTAQTLVLTCVNIRNTYTLPETGSVGTRLFTRLGIFMMLAAGLLSRVLSAAGKKHVFFHCQGLKY